MLDQMGNPLIESLFKKFLIMKKLRSCLLVLATTCRTQAGTTNAPLELAVPSGQCFNSKSPITL